MTEHPLIDFYRVLGIGPTATPQEISTAYLSLARKHHPDSSGRGVDSTSKFKAIAEAYEILSDPEKRRSYDRQRTGYVNSIRRSRYAEPINPVRSSPASRPFKPGVFGRFDGPDQPTSVMSGGWQEGQPVQASALVAELPISPEEAHHGANISMTLTTSRRCVDCAGSRCPSCCGRGRLDQKLPLQVRVPPAIHDGALLRVPGGDCLLRIRIRPCW